MTKLEFINKFFFQFLFVRLTKHMKKDEYGNYTITDRFSFMYFVIPFTGWSTNYKYLGKCNFFYLK